jgi:FRG domain
MNIHQHADNFYTNVPFYPEDPTPPTIRNVDDLLALVRKLREELKGDPKAARLWEEAAPHSQAVGLYFRGQNKFSDRLVPSAGRPSPGGMKDLVPPAGTAGSGAIKDLPYSEEQERNFLHRFRRRSYAHYGRILTEWETLFLARHYFLPCRLLDWSSNPLVGLFWACHGRDSYQDPGAVWVFLRQPKEEWDLNVFDAPLFDKKYTYAHEFKFAVQGVKIIFPFNVSPRITAQACVFTYQDKPEQPLETYDPSCFVRENFDLFLIRKWLVPALDKKPLLRELNDVGVNIQTLYPDLQELGEGIPEIEALRENQLTRP